jgi:hypothetical protein
MRRICVAPLEVMPGTFSAQASRWRCPNN